MRHQRHQLLTALQGTLEETCFRIKKTSQLKKMMDAYAQRLQIDVRTLKCSPFPWFLHIALCSQHVHAAFFSAVHRTPVIVHCRFMFDGNALTATQTPEELDMCDDDMIDACLFQVGGAALACQAAAGCCPCSHTLHTERRRMR